MRQTNSYFDIKNSKIHDKMGLQTTTLVVTVGQKTENKVWVENNVNLCSVTQYAFEKWKN